MFSFIDFLKKSLTNSAVNFSLCGFFSVVNFYLCGFFTPPDKGADFLAALEARCLRGALAPVDFLAVYFVLAIWIPKICKFYKKNYWYLGKKKIIVFKYTYTKKNYFF